MSAPVNPLPDWTALSADEKGDAILPFLAAGESNNKIASRFLNCGRSQISGAVNRMKVKGKSPPSRRANLATNRSRPGPKPKLKEQKPPKAAPAPRGRKMRLIAGAPQVQIGPGPKASSQYDFKARALQRASSPPIVVNRAAAFEPIPGIEPVPFGSPGCKWPVDSIEGQGLLACGARKEPERSYCEAHRLLSYQPPSLRQRADVKSAERISA